MPYPGKYIPSDKGGKTGGTAGNKDNLARTKNIYRHAVELPVILHQGLPNNRRLFFDFFYHEMRVIAFPRLRKVPRYVNRRPLFRMMFKIIYLIWFFCHNNAFAVFDINHFTGIRQERQGITPNKICIFADTKNHRAVLPGSKQFTIRQGGDNNNGKRTLQLPYRGKKSIFKIQTGIDLFPDKMRDNFGVGIRLELVFLAQTVF